MERNRTTLLNVLFQSYELSYRVFDGLESNIARVQVSVREQNLFPPRFQKTVYDYPDVKDVPEVLENSQLPYNLATVRVILCSFSFICM